MYLEGFLLDFLCCVFFCCLFLAVIMVLWNQWSQQRRTLNPVESDPRRFQGQSRRRKENGELNVILFLGVEGGGAG